MKTSAKLSNHKEKSALVCQKNEKIFWKLRHWYWEVSDWDFENKDLITSKSVDSSFITTLQNWQVCIFSVINSLDDIL